jgi:hypothetical protein
MENNSVGKYLLTFGGGAASFRVAAHRVGREAKKSNCFEKIFVVTDTYNECDFSSFLKKNESFIANNPLGYGRWCWKPFLVNHFLKEIPEGSSLMYVDAGCHLNLTTFESVQKIQDYFELARQRLIFTMQLRDRQFGDEHPDLTESAFTTRELAEKIGLTREHLSTNQIEAGFFIVNNSRVSRELVDEWLKLSEEKFHKYLLDPEVPSETFPNFVAYRQDQSIFSALIKKHGIEPMSNESYFHPNWTETGAAFPVWTIRNCRGSDPFGMWQMWVTQAWKRIRRALN